MIIQRKSLIGSALVLLTLSMSAVVSAETIKKPDGVNKPTAMANRSKSNIKHNVVKPGTGVGADEHGCIAPGIWHEPSKSCVTDVLPDKPKGNQTMKKSQAAPFGVKPGKKHNYVGHVTLLR